jgi:hypothetical protein
MIVESIMGIIARFHENFEDWPSAKIGPHENFPLYGKIMYMYMY